MGSDAVAWLATQVSGAPNEGGEARGPVTERTSWYGDDPRGIGYIGWFESSDGEWYVQRMRWTRAGGKWRGHWVWTRCHGRKSNWWDEMWIDKEAFDRAIETGAGHHLPQEILAHIAVRARDWLHVRERFTISIVCREWRRLCFPGMLTYPRIRNEDLPRFVRCIRHSEKGALSTVTRLELCAMMLWRVLHDVGRFLGPTLKCLKWTSSRLDVAVPAPFDFPPLHTATMRLCTLFAQLRQLGLKGCDFNSTRDLLHLIASLPFLKIVELEDVKCRRSSHNTPRRRLTPQVLEIAATNLPVTTWSPTLALSWTWPVSQCGGRPSFPGMRRDEASIAVSIIGCLEIVTGVNTGASAASASRFWLNPAMDPASGLCTSCTP